MSMKTRTKFYSFIVLFVGAFLVANMVRTELKIDTGFDSSEGWSSKIPSECYVDTGNSRLHTYFHVQHSGYIYHSLPTENRDLLTADFDMYIPSSGLQFVEGADVGFGKSAGALMDWRTDVPRFSGGSIHVNFWYRDNASPHYLLYLRAVDSAGMVIASTSAPGDLYGPDTWHHVRLSWDGHNRQASLQLWDGQDPETSSKVADISLDLSSHVQNFSFNYFEFANAYRQDCSYNNHITFLWDNLKVNQTTRNAPRLMSYQGRITGQDQMPLPGDTVDMTFNFYGDQSGNTLLLSVLQEDVSVENGTYNLLIGSGVISDGVESTLDAVFSNHSEVWMGVKVGPDPEMQPLTPITTVPYAFIADKGLSADRAGQAEKLQGWQGGITTDDGIKINATQNDVKIKAGNSEITVDPTGGITIQTTEAINLTSTDNDVSISGKNVSVTAEQSLNLSSTSGDVIIDSAADTEIYSGMKTLIQPSTDFDVTAGSGFDIIGTGPSNIHTSGTMDIQGSMIHLN